MFLYILSLTSSRHVAAISMVAAGLMLCGRVAHSDYSENSWDWTDDRPVTLFYYTSNRPNSVNSVTVRLPWFDSDRQGITTSPAALALNVNESVPGRRKDIYPDLGWVLLAKDFGTPVDPQGLPYILLYNKYTGVARIVFFYPRVDETFSHFLVRLRQPNGDDATKNFLFVAEDRAFDSDFDKNQEQVGISKVIPGEWSYVDFNLAGYDPNPKPGAKFVFEFVGVKQGTLKLTGRIDPLGTGPGSSVGSASIGEGNKLVEQITERGGQIKDAVAQGFKYYTEAKNWLGDVEKFAARKANEGVSDIGDNLVETLFALTTGAAKDFIPGIGAVAGVAGSFIGGISGIHQSNSFEVALSGNIDFETQIAQLALPVPGSKNSLNSVPLYNKRLGVIMLRDRPIILYVADTRIKPNYIPELTLIVRDLEYEINPDIVDGEYTVRFNLSDPGWPAEHDEPLWFSSGALISLRFDVNDILKISENFHKHQSVIMKRVKFQQLPKLKLNMVVTYTGHGSSKGVSHVLTRSYNPVICGLVEGPAWGSVPGHRASRDDWPFLKLMSDLLIQDINGTRMGYPSASSIIGISRVYFGEGSNGYKLTENNRAVEAWAGNKVVLKPGFQAYAGSQFTATVGDKDEFAKMRSNPFDLDDVFAAFEKDIIHVRCNSFPPFQKAFARWKENNVEK
jgi:hypothetical protein